MISCTKLSDIFMSVLIFIVGIIWLRLLGYNLCLIVDGVNLLFSHALLLVIVVTPLIISIIVSVCSKINSIFNKVESLSVRFTILISIVRCIGFIIDVLTMSTAN